LRRRPRPKLGCGTKEGRKEGIISCPVQQFQTCEDENMCDFFEEY
jgi:hypothetical protein